MLKKFCRAKIHRATVTHSRLDYEGSIEIDSSLMAAAGIEEFEVVLVGNLSNGARFETYVIKGRRGSGVVGLNGAAARLGVQGDKLIILSTAWLDSKEAARMKPVFISVDEKNRIKKKTKRTY